MNGISVRLAFAHVAASSVMVEATYVDSDRRAEQFCSDRDGGDELIAAHRPTGERARYQIPTLAARQPWLGASFHGGSTSTVAAGRAAPPPSSPGVTGRQRRWRVPLRTRA